jgi:hypothetical protein
MDETASLIEQHYKQIFGENYRFSTSDKTSCTNFVKLFGIDEVLTAIDIANSNCKLQKHDWRYISGILRMRKDERNDPVRSCANYAYYILNKKFGRDISYVCENLNIDNPKNLITNYVYRAVKNGFSTDEIISSAKSVFDFEEFCLSINKEAK